MPKIRWLVAYAVITFMAAITITTFFREFNRLDRLSASVETRMEHLVDLTRKNQELEEKISYYKTPAGIAHLAREQFNLVRPGEKMYRMEIVTENGLRDQER